MSTHWQCNNPVVEAGIGIGTDICIFILYQLVFMCVHNDMARQDLFSRVHWDIYIYIHSSVLFAQQMLNACSLLSWVVHR